MTERRKRATDSEGENHVDERTQDILTAPPKWLIPALVSAASGIGMTLGTALFHLVMQREAEIKLAYVPPTQVALANLETRIYRVEVQIQALNERLPAYNEMNHRMAELGVSIDRLNRKLKKEN